MSVSESGRGYDRFKSGLRGDSPELAAYTQIREIVPIQEWLRSEYYVGDEAGSLYQYWQDVLVEIFDRDHEREGLSKYNEVCFTGSLGTGKSYAMLMAFLRSIYVLTCFDFPQSIFGLSRSKSILYIYLSVSLNVSEITGFHQLRNIVDQAPYFRDEVKRRKEVSSRLDFVKSKIMVVQGSGVGHFIGSDLFGSVLDEANFAKMGASAKIQFNQAMKTYLGTYNRRVSRFMHQGRLFGFSGIASSSETQSSFVEKRMEEMKGNVKVFTINAKLWEVRPDRFRKQRFQVFKGNGVMDAALMSRRVVGRNGVPTYPEDESALDRYRASLIEPVEARLTLAQLVKRHPEDFLTVPTDLYEAFSTNLDQALRDIGGVASGGIGGLPIVRECYNACFRTGRPHPFKQQVVTISTADARRLEDFVDWRALRAQPGTKYFVHVDLAEVSDCAGIAMVHREMVKGRGFSDSVYVVDFMLQIPPPPSPARISIRKIREFLIYLKREKGFQIEWVTSDSFGCLVADSMVPTNRGLLPIQDVVKGDFVYSREGWSPVESTVRYQGAPTIKVVSERGSIQGTPNHRIEVLSPECLSKGNVTFGLPTVRPWRWVWKRFDELVPGDIAKNEWPLSEAPQEALVSLEGSLSLKAVTGMKGALTGFEMPPFITEDLAEIMGFLYGDGSLDKDGLRFTSIPPEKFNPVYDRVRCFFGESACHVQEDRQGTRTLRVFSRLLIDLLRFNGFDKTGSHDVRIPDKILQSPRRVLAAFLRGLYSADGHIGGQNIVLTTVSKRLAEEVSAVLRTVFGVESALVVSDTRGRKHECGGRVMVDKSVFYLVNISGEGSRKRFGEIGFFVDRKQERYLKISGVKGRRQWNRVVSVENGGKQDVYDLQVEGDPSYVVNGFMSHNSAETIQELNAVGIKSQVRSVDRTDAESMTLVNLINEQRLFAYFYQQLDNEIWAVQWDRGRHKVDHVPGGQKDVLDGLTGSVADALDYFADTKPVQNIGVIAELLKVGDYKPDSARKEFGFVTADYEEQEGNRVSNLEELFNPSPRPRRTTPPPRPKTPPVDDRELRVNRDLSLTRMLLRRRG